VNKINIHVNSAVEIPQERLKKRLNEVVSNEVGSINQTAHGEKDIDYVGLGCSNRDPK